MAQQAHQGKAMAIIGGGIMGGDIASIFAAGGWQVHIMSPSQKTRDALPARLEAAVKKLGADVARAKAIQLHAKLEDLPWKDLDLVVESATEDLELKRKLFLQFETLAKPDTIFATNTSTFPIGEIGRHLKTRSRVAGLHYFMPAHLVPLVEVIKADFTDTKVCDQLEQWSNDLGKAPIRVDKDVPGFVGNRLQHALVREALYLVADGVTTPEGIDKAVRYGFGFRFIACGPMMQKEMSGWDTNLYAGTSLYPSLHTEKKPPQFLADMVEKGHIGMKTKRGVWEWTDDKIAKEKARIERALQKAFEILKSE
jgi:3-hydroxybutyryl-CoA dehydrogenase